MRPNRTAILMAFALVLAPVGPASAQSTEEVLLESVSGDTAIVVRGISSRYRIEKGVGCLSLDRYEGRHVTIVSPGFFLGAGSMLKLPDIGQECRIWDSSELRGGAGGTEDVKVTTRVALALTAAALGIAYLMSRR